MNIIVKGKSKTKKSVSISTKQTKKKAYKSSLEKRNMEIIQEYITNNMSKVEKKHLESLAKEKKDISWIMKCMTQLKDNATAAELKVMKALRVYNMNFIFQAPFVIRDKIFFADFFLPDFDTILEIDGGYHLTSEQRRNDMRRDLFFATGKYRTIRISNKDSFCLDKIIKTLGKLSTGCSESAKRKRQIIAKTMLGDYGTFRVN